MICHLLSELVLFSSKVSYTKVPNINSMRQSHEFLPAIVRSQKSPEVSSSLTPQLPSFVDDWGTNQQSMFGRDRFRRGTKSENCRVYRVWGMWNVVGNIFFTFWFIWYCFISLFFSNPLTDLLELVLPIDKVVNMY